MSKPPARPDFTPILIGDVLTISQDGSCPQKFKVVETFMDVDGTEAHRLACYHPPECLKGFSDAGDETATAIRKRGSRIWVDETDKGHG